MENFTPSMFCRIQLAQFPLEGRWLDPKVAQRPHRHVAADTREAIEIENAHTAHWLHSKGPKRKGRGLIAD
jgi:hypothetical protein